MMYNFYTGHPEHVIYVNCIFDLMSCNYYMYVYVVVCVLFIVLACVWMHTVHTDAYQYASLHACVYFPVSQIIHVWHDL